MKRKTIVFILIAVLLLSAASFFLYPKLFPPIKLYFATKFNTSGVYSYDNPPISARIEIANGRMALTSGVTDYILEGDHYAYVYDYGFHTTEESVTKTIPLPLWRLIQIYSACDWRGFRGNDHDVWDDFSFVAILEDHGYHRSTVYRWNAGYPGDPERDVISSVLASIPKHIITLPEFKCLYAYRQDIRLDKIREQEREDQSIMLFQPRH